MTKRTKQTKKTKKPGGNVRKAVVPGARGAGLDAAALAYARLLEDPCRAELTHPVYMAGTSGYLTRIKQVVQLGLNPNAVDGYTAFQPGGLPTVTSSMTGMWHGGWANAAGGTLNTIAGTTGPAFLISATVGQYRPVAGCLKVHYTGSELNRAGLISVGICNQLQLANGETGIGPVATYVPSTARTARLGTEPHEVRWVPSVSQDMTFTGSSQPTSTSQVVGMGTVIYVFAQGVPAGSCLVEVDFVYEWVPETSQGMTQSVQAPRSANTTADVLRALGSAYGGLTEFATSPLGKRVFGGIARGIYAMANAKAVPLLAM